MKRIEKGQILSQYHNHAEHDQLRRSIDAWLVAANRTSFRTTHAGCTNGSTIKKHMLAEAILERELSIELA